MPVEATRRLAGFVADSTGVAVSGREKTLAKVGLLDSLGVALAGTTQGAGRAVAAFVHSQVDAGDTSVWGHGFRTSPSLATLANGTAAHALDFDDVNWALLGHPSASLTPTVLAVAEQEGRSGAAVVEAYACGFEVMTKIGRTCMPALSLDGGWHATSAIGTLGTTAAASHLMGLSRDQIQHAIGIAVSHASGVVQNFGSMTKPLHAGLAAQAGIQAAGLAKHGFTANPDAIEGKHGFYSSFARALPMEPEWLDQLGAPSELETTGLVIKPYPCGVAGHPAIDAAIELRARLTHHELDRVERIEVHATSYTIDKMRYTWPNNELQAKFSLHYQVAKALLEGPLELRHFKAESLEDDRASQLASMTTLHLDEEIEREWRTNGGSRPCRIVLSVAGGRTEEAFVRVSKGNPGVPLTDAELLHKLTTCAAPVLGGDGSKRVATTIKALEDVPNVRELCTLLRGPSPAGQDA